MRAFAVRRRRGAAKEEGEKERGRDGVGRWRGERGYLGVLRLKSAHGSAACEEEEDKA